MHLGTAALLDFHERHHGEPMVLATIISTRGSTYRKPGAMMLIAPDKSYAGLISGGCLEGDLLGHAEGVFKTGKPQKVVYDMHSEEDLVWGMGIGCDGAIELLLVRLDEQSASSFFDGIGAALEQRQSVALALVIDSQNDSLPVGTITAFSGDGQTFGSSDSKQRLFELAGSQWPEGRFEYRAQPDCKMMLVNLQPKPRLLLCGGGPDANPVAAQAVMMGWECIVIDHRAAYANEQRFPPETTVLLARPENLSEKVDLQEVDAAVIMSHHLESDAAYLRQLGPVAEGGTLSYLGVLGPTARRNRLRDMSDCPDVLVHGPVGLDIGAELPEAIALSVIAEIHAVLNQRDGQSLTTGPVGDAH